MSKLFQHPLEALEELFSKPFPEPADGIEAAFTEMAKRLESAREYDIHVASLFTSRDLAVRAGEYKHWTRENLYLAIAYYMLQVKVRWEKEAMDLHNRMVRQPLVVDSIGE